MSGGDAAKKKLRKKLERELQINLRDIFLIWSSTILGVFMTYFFENGINQYRAGFVMPEMYHIVIDPIIFVGVFMFGALIYTAIIVPVLRYLMIRFLASAGVDRL